MTAGQGSAPKRDHRQEVTDSIIKLLEEGVAPWQKPWDSALSMPMNPTTGREYRGGNAIHLMATGMARAFEDPRWLTYKQAAENGWQVRRGEKGTQIEFWDIKRDTQRTDSEPPDKPDPTKDEASRSRLIHRIYTVFNAKQIDGIPAHSRPERSAFEAVESGERILANSGASIAHDQQDRAFYSRSADSIHLPAKTAFLDAASYYGTALHELGHWTGHPSRLNRTTLNESYRFGDLNYAKEELRAELASVLLAAETGIPHNPANHAAYVGSWIKALKEDKNEIFRAAHDASAATDYVLALEREVSRAEALEVDTSDTPEATRVDALRDEAALLEADREPPVRETTQSVTRYEPDSGTVGVHQKREGQDAHTPVESSPLTDSLAAAKTLSSQILGGAVRTYEAQTQSGTYKGKIVAETEHHLIQKLSAQTAITHAKELLDPVPQVGQNVSIQYANENGRVKPMTERAKSRELVR
jgi:antirestriction protein ArdC